MSFDKGNSSIDRILTRDNSAKTKGNPPVDTVMPDRKRFSKIFKLSVHPLHKQVPKAKVIDYNLHYKNSARTLINTKHFKDTFINRLTYKYDLHM